MICCFGDVVVGTGRDQSVRDLSVRKIKSLSELMGAYKTTVSKQIHLAGYAGLRSRVANLQRLATLNTKHVAFHQHQFTTVLFYFISVIFSSASITYSFGFLISLLIKIQE